MGKLTGAVFLVAGVTMAAYALAERQRTAAESAAPAGQHAAETSAAPRTAGLLEGQAKVDGATPGARQPPAAAAPPPPVADKRPEPQPPPVDGRSSAAPAPLQIAEAPPRVPVDHNKPARTVALDREGLTKAIQHHLKRVGCYGGAITGEWTPGVRRAMKAFTERVNATLPVEEPDDVLLALVQSHRRIACGGTACPPGQATSDYGSCRPNALVARTKKSNAPPSVDTGGPTTSAAGTPEERMSLAGPSPPAKRTARTKRSRWSDTRARDRRRARTSSGPGMPWWAIPLFSP